MQERECTEAPERSVCTILPRVHMDIWVCRAQRVISTAGFRRRRLVLLPPGPAALHSFRDGGDALYGQKFNRN